jgi:hypothetical protein
MADDKRPFRANESYGRPAAGGAGGNDPLAELARLIGQTDPFSEFGRDGRRAAAAPQAPPPAPPFRSNVPPQNFGAQQFHPPAPQQFGAQQFAAGSDLYRTGLEEPALDHQQPPPYDATAYYQDSAASASHGNEIYDDEEPPARRRISVIAIAGILALAVIGTAGAFGYRAFFGSSGSSPPPVIKADTAPSKIVPSSNETQSNKLITDRVGDRSQTEKLVSREEQPIDMKDKPPQAVFPGMPNASTPSLAASPANSAGAAGEPKKVRTIAIKPDQLTGAPEAPPALAPARTAAVTPPEKPAPAPRVTAAEPDEAKPGPGPIRQIPIRQAAAPANAPLSLNPNVEPAVVPVRPASPPVRAAAPARVVPQAVASAVVGGSYLVQVSSQRSEADAQSSFRALQGKFPTQLGSRQPVIRRADLGDKGTYYRAMVGPFANAGAANELCSSLKTAGGQCIVQKN